jgi:membrane dipeptidase
MDRREFTLGAASLAALAAIGSIGPAWALDAEPAIGGRARALHRRAIVLDGNLGPPGFEGDVAPPDVVAQLRSAGVTAIKTSIGGFNAPFEDTVRELASYQAAVEANPGLFLQVRDADDFAAAKRSGRLGIVFSFESATCLGENLDNIDLFRGLGVRVMQLSYNLPSPFGAGVMSPPESGLTELGRKAIARMNERGVALDLSHANPATTLAAMSASTQPVLITHGGCSAVHAHPRNKSDAQLRALADKGGVFGIYDLFYLAPSPRQPNLDDYLAHMAHALQVCGEDHVGIGSDASFGTAFTTAEERAGWDQVQAQRHASGVAAPEEDRYPYTEGLNRADRALVIADGPLRRGYSERVVEKVLGANFVRAFREIW